MIQNDGQPSKRQMEMNEYTEAYDNIENTKKINAVSIKCHYRPNYEVTGTQKLAAFYKTEWRVDWWYRI